MLALGMKLFSWDTLRFSGFLLAVLFERFEKGVHMTPNHSPAPMSPSPDMFSGAPDEASQDPMASMTNSASSSTPAHTAPPPTPPAPPTPPREMGSIYQELVTRPAKGILDGLLGHFDVLPKPTDDPDTKARKQKIHQKMGQMSAEQQQEVQRRAQLAKQKQQQEAEQKQLAEQRRQQEAAQTRQVPTSVKKGPEGPGKGKKAATNMLNQNRKTLSGPASVN